MEFARRRARRRPAFALPLLTFAAGALLAVGPAQAPAGTPAGESGAAGKARVARDACTRYAAPGGSDSSRGTKRRPFRTAQRLADSLRPGQIGCLRGGVYGQADDRYVLKLERGGRRGTPLTIRSYPGERATLVGAVWIPEAASHVTLSHLTIRGIRDEKTIKIYTAGVAVMHSDISSPRLGRSCMILGSTSGYGQAVGTIIRGNRFHDCGGEEENLGHGIYAQNVVGARITGNVFWRMQKYAIQFYPFAQGTYFAHNVIDGGPPSVRGGVLFGGNEDYASSGNVVERNVIAYARTANITSGWDETAGSGNVARRNCVWGAGDENIDGSDGGFVAEGNVVARPSFVNRQRHDYRLRRGSRCRRVVGFARPGS